MIRTVQMLVIVALMGMSVGCGYSGRVYKADLTTVYKAAESLYSREKISIYGQEPNALLAGMDPQGYKNLMRFSETHDGQTYVRLKISPSNDDLKEKRFAQIGELLPK